MKNGKEEKTKCSKILPNNQIITACCIELQVQEMTMIEKLTMIGLRYTIWDRSLIRVERGYDVAYFLFISRLQK